MSRETRWTWSGDTYLQARLRKLRRIADHETERAMVDTAGEILELSRTRVPVDTGFLSKSVFINRPTKRSGRLDVVFGFEAPYAGIVHETYAGFKGERYYLRSAVDELAPNLRERVVRNNLKGFRMGLKGG